MNPRMFTFRNFDLPADQPGRLPRSEPLSDAAQIKAEIERICQLTHPQISIVVEVGPQHLERFGTLENTATAKYEIIKALPPDGLGVFNWDNQ